MKPVKAEDVKRLLWEIGLRLCDRCLARSIITPTFKVKTIKKGAFELSLEPIGSPVIRADVERGNILFICMLEPPYEIDDPFPSERVEVGEAMPEMPSEDWFDDMADGVALHFFLRRLCDAGYRFQYELRWDEQPHSIARRAWREGKALALHEREEP